jgi:isopentenyl-diphosphate delta-isomerase
MMLAGAHPVAVATGTSRSFGTISLAGFAGAPLTELTLNDAIRSCDRAAANDVSGTDSDALILVDEADREVGFLSKDLCHDGQGTLHRAFSLLVFNESGELLLQQRAPSKRLWPLYWSNSCCSHPRRGESMEAAIKRRLYEELGLSCPLHFLFKFRYQAQFDARGAEHELCSVYIARCSEEVIVNRHEILGWRWIAPEALEAEMSGSGADMFTPWFKLEWARVWREHRAAVWALQ